VGGLCTDWRLGYLGCCKRNLGRLDDEGKIKGGQWTGELAEVRDLVSNGLYTWGCLGIR